MALHRPNSGPQRSSLLSFGIILKFSKLASNVENLKLFHNWCTSQLKSELPTKIQNCTSLYIPVVWVDDP